MSNKTFAYFVVGGLLMAAGLVLALGVGGLLISLGAALIVVAKGRYSNLVQFGDEDL